MVDRSDLIVCCIERENGCAWQTVKYAMGHGKTVINLANEDESVKPLRIRSATLKIDFLLRKANWLCRR